MYMSGFHHGYFILEALRESQLECLYDHSCLNDILFHMTTLDSSMLIHFSPNTTIRVIMDDMMVDG